MNRSLPKEGGTSEFRVSAGLVLLKALKSANC